ncbi:hypothetical protein [Sagittula sp. S175]|uniref:hypothetical protein n=1 Tax=Sagittula sp. S175 TaxID=3415129 RepID=UPI003C7E05CC
MYVTRIEFAGFKPTPNGPFSGSVVLVSEDTRMQIPLTMPRRVEVQHSRHRLLLLAEALRKARRIPDYRQRGRLRFAPGVLPPELRRA